MTNSKKTVYVALSVDLIHPGHLNIISHARKLGSVIIGLLTDKAIISYKKPPIMNYEDRYKIASSLKGVDKVVPQQTLDYEKNLNLLKRQVENDKNRLEIGQISLSDLSQSESTLAGADAKNIKAIREYGWKRERYVSELVGRNSRMDEIQAAILRIKLKNLDKDN